MAMAELEPLQTKPEQESETAWVAIGVGIAIMAIVVGALVLLSRSKPAGTATVDPYAAKLQVSEVKMSAAENFVGGTVSYLEGKISNTGDKAVADAVLEVTFRNSLGEVVQKEAMPVRALQPHSVTGTAEMFDLHMAPLQPGKTIDFRLTFEHISNDWNHEYPQLKWVRVATK